MTQVSSQELAEAVDPTNVTPMPVTDLRAATSSNVDTAQQMIESAFAAGWTDGLPTVPCSPRLLAEFLERTSRDPEEVVMRMTHLNRQCTVREAAVNAIMAGCLPEYFPVVLAALDSLEALGVGPSALWQSTTGTAPFIIVNGPIRNELQINSQGNIFGSGFRANATIGRTIRLITLNVFMLRPHLLDQATQASPAKYTCCIAENEEASPWPAFHEEFGFAANDSTVATMLIRGTLYMESRQTSNPEQLANDFVDSIVRTGRILGDGGTTCLVLSPEHARVFGDANWSKADIRSYIFDHATRTIPELNHVGKGAISRRTRWRVPQDHPDAILPEDPSQPHPVLKNVDAIDILVAGADNAGVSTIVENFGPSARPLPFVKVEGA